ncbi:hypothetical protein KI387_034961, partial [Taxus chinensis]
LGKAKSEGRKSWRVVGDQQTRKGISIDESDRPIIEDCNSSASESGSLFVELNSPTGEGPSFDFEKFSSHSTPVFSEVDRDFQETRPLGDTHFE